MQEDVQNRVDTAVPHPEVLDKFTEEEKRALELEGEIEHAHGTKRDDMAGEAEDEIKKKDERES